MSSRIAVTLRFSREEFTLSKRGSYQSILAPKSLPVGAPGEPALPWRKVYLSIPPGSRPTGLEYDLSRVSLLAADVLIEPIQPDQPTLLGSKLYRVDPDSRVYESDTTWPQVPARLVGVRRLGDQYMAEIELCPLRYLPRSRRLELLGRVDLSLIYEPAPQPRRLIRNVDELRFNLRMADRARALVANKNDVDRFLPRRDLEAPQPTGGQLPQLFDYVIITNDAMSGAFGELAQWRSQFGLHARVVRVGDILANQVPDTNGAVFNYAAGYYDGGTRDTAEAVRNFVKWAALHWDTSYVLLGGDVDLIPERHAVSAGVGRLELNPLDYPDTRQPRGSNASASSHRLGYDASGVVDSSSQTEWQCTPADQNPWIRINVGTNRPINHVTLTWGAHHASAYRIAVSRDGNTWTDVYTTASAPGGTEEISFGCVSATFVRLSISSGTSFNLITMQAYGPWSDWNALARQINPCRTRVYLCFGVSPNPTNDLNVNRLIIMDGPAAGTVIPYDEHANDAVAGWHFVDDLLDPNAAVTPSAGSFLEIRGPAAVHGHNMVMVCEMNYIPADLYYSDVAASEYPQGVDHDWEPNRNGVYGECYGGGVDRVNGFADVYLGRVPVSSESEATNYVSKVKHYETYTDAAGNPLPAAFAISVLLGSENWDPQGAGANLDGSAAGKEDIRHTYLAAAPGRFIFTRRYQDHADVNPADQGPDLGQGGTNEIVTAIQAGCNVTSLTSHGSSGYLCYLVTSDVQGLNNIPSIWYGNACLTNKFDVSPGDAISEWTLMNTHGGAVGYVGNSRFGWTSDNPIELAFWREMLDSGVLGHMFAECKQLSGDWQKYSLNLLGDPALRIWSDRPATLEVSVITSHLCLARKEVLQVRVYKNGQPAANINVVVTQNGALLGSGVTDANGIVGIFVTPGSIGMADIAVFAQNCIPVLRQIEVKDCGPGVCTQRVDCIHLVCHRDLQCGPAIVCERLVCRNALPCVQLVCPHGLACDPSIACRRLVPCGGRLTPGCNALRPEEFDIFAHIRDIWNVRTVEEFMQQVDEPEFEEKMRRLPEELRRPIRMLVQRLRGVQ